jgi:hypothetical protein
MDYFIALASKESIKEIVIKLKRNNMILQKAIAKEQDKLINKVRTKGLYENFGQREVRKLEDRFINSSSYTDEMNMNRLLIEGFNEWCMNYS